MIQALEDTLNSIGAETLSSKFGILHIASHGLQFEESKEGSCVMLETDCKCGTNHITAVKASGLATLIRHTVIKKNNYEYKDGHVKRDKRDPPQKFPLIVLNSCSSEAMVSL